MKSRKIHFSNKKHFSLVELAVSTAILMILISLLVPSLRTMMGVSEKISCANHLKFYGQATGLYQEDFNHSLPPIQGMRDGISQDRNYYDKYILGQYLNHEKQWFVDEKVKQVLCPSVSGFAIETNAQGELFSTGYGMNSDIGFEGANNPMAQLKSSDDIGSPSKYIVFLDGMSVKWWHGWGRYESWQDNYPFTNKWSMSAKGSSFNYSLRHDGECNMLILDGHVTSTFDLLHDVKQKALTGSYEDRF